MGKLAIVTVSLAGALQLATPIAGASGSGTAAAPPRLELPVRCHLGADCWVQNYVDRDPSPSARDFHCGALTYDGHKGTDIRVADLAAENRGVDVLAAADGRVLRVRDGVPDISIRAPNAPSTKGIECGNGLVIDHGGGWNTQYCHMRRGSIVVKPGDTVRAGGTLGQMGLSGDTEFPHLHFSVTHDAAIVDPFSLSPGCGDGPALWKSPLAYVERTVVSAGFASKGVESAEIDAGGIPPAKPDSDYLVAYVMAIGLHAGDRISLSLEDPKGAPLAASKDLELTANKATHFVFVGKRRPGERWPPGAYTATYSVRGKADAVVLKKVIRIKL